MNLTITQDNTRTETINSSIIDKLYEIAFAASSDPNSTVSLTGRLESPKGYASKIQWLNTNFSPDLTITVPVAGQYIDIADNAVLQVLLTGGFSSDGVGISLDDAANATFTSSTFANNTDITSFNEFGYFTKANGNSQPNDLFYGCTNLTSINLSEVTVLKDNFARESGVTTVNAPNLTYLGSNVFYQCTSLTTVESLGYITTIGGSDFLGCSNLQTINIPSTCTKISSKCFSSCTNLHLDVGTLPKSITEFGGEVFYGNLNYVTGVLDLPNLTSLGNRTFQNTNITGVTCLGKYNLTNSGTFQQGQVRNRLQYAYIPFECTTIGDSTFCGQSGLTTLKQYSESVDNWVNGQSSSFFPNLSKITRFEQYCLVNCASLPLTNADITNAVTIGKSAFNGCTLLTGSISLPNLTSLEASAFQNTNITSVTSLGQISSIGGYCFSNCKSLTSVILPSTCTSLNAYCFDGCSLLTTIDVSNVKTFGQRCFQNNTGISVLDLSSATNITNQAFWNLGDITLTIPSVPFTSTGDGFVNGTRLLNLHGSVENWITINRHFPRFADSSAGIDVLNFKNATEIGDFNGIEVGLCTDSTHNVSIKNMYVPKLQNIYTNLSNTYNRIQSVFGIGVQSFVTTHLFLKIGLLYFKDLTEIISSPFGGLVCQALIINNTTPPTITPQIYSTLSEYNSTLSNVKVNAWAEIEDATDPTATVTYTGGNYSTSYEINKKLRNYPTITAIYVPDSAVNTYKTTTGWTSVASLIQPISSLNSGVVYATQQDWETAGKPVGLIAECLDLSTADLATFMTANNLTYWTNPNA